MRDEEDQQLRELQDPGSWDWDRAELHPPSRDRRVTLAVEFTSEEFGRVSLAAEDAGVLTTDFVRRTVLAHVSAEAPRH